MRQVIDVNGLSKTYRTIQKREGLRGSFKNFFSPEYKDKVAVKDISFQINEGEFVGFIGPNGAGKTTTIKMLSGIIYPSSGNVNILGYVPHKLDNEFKNSISVTLGQRQQLWWDIPPRDSFRLLRLIYGIEEQTFKRVCQQLTEIFDVGSLLETPLRNLSLGERMKMELIAAFLHEPKILFLDEPTIGLDVNARKSIREFLRYNNQEKKTTILLTSHYLEDVEYLCNRIIAINNGEKIYDGGLKKFKRGLGDKKIVKVSSFSSGDLEILRKYTDYSTINQNQIKMKVDLHNMAELGQLLFRNPSYFDISIEDVALEEAFEHYLGDAHK